jgi:tRNA-modifying protein YgfZ
MTPASVSPAYDAARHHAAITGRDHGLIVVSGADRATYLQGLFTNDIAALTAGQGCYSAYLTAQGRMITDLYVYELGDAILLKLQPGQKNSVLAKLDQFIFAEDVQLSDVSSTFAALAVIGPHAGQLLGDALGAGSATLDGLAPHGNLRCPFESEPAIVLRIDDAGVAGFEVVLSRDRAARLSEALRAAGATDLDPSTAEQLRVEGGVPLFGRDMDNDTIPLEAGIEHRAISFTKGCYVGQEVVIRVLHRGHGRVARKLVGLTFDAPQAPPSGTALHVDDKAMGEVTSSVFSPALGRPIALGYVKRDFVAPGTRVTTAGGAGGEVVALPFV